MVSEVLEMSPFRDGIMKFVDFGSAEEGYMYVVLMSTSVANILASGLDPATILEK